MRKIVYSLVLALVFSCSRNESFTVEPEKDKLFNFKGVVEVKNGNLHFKDGVSFLAITENILNSTEYRSMFNSFIKEKGFQNIYDVYDKIPEVTLEQIAKNKKVPENLKNYLCLEEEGGELVLKELLRSTILRQYFSTNLQFKIGDEIIFMEKGQLFRSTKNGKEILWVKNNPEQNLNSASRGQGGYAEYSHGGTDYRLKVESDTSLWWTTHYTNNAYPNVWKTWNTAEFWAHHRRRSWGVWIASDTDWVKVNGTFSYVNGASLINWSFNVQTNGVNDASYGSPNVLSYNYTGSCKGKDNNEYEYTISEFRNQ